MDERTKHRLRELAQQDLSAAMDNLRRAEIAANSVDPTREFGESGKTLISMIDEYRSWAETARKTLAEIG